jgi:hypothetical protein
MIQRTVTADRTTEWVFRHCKPEHANLEETLRASRDHDHRGRFHVQGRFGAVYVARDHDTVLADLLPRGLGRSSGRLERNEKLRAKD